MAVDKDSSLVGETLISISKKINTRVLICAVQRDDDVIIPSGRFKIQEGDKICFTANAKELREFLTEANIIKSPLKNIMIIGGNRIAYYLAKLLSKKKYTIKLMEENKERAEKFADELSRVTVITGSGTQHDVLIEEGIESMDSLVALTDIDEENMIVSMFAHSVGVKKTITQIQNENLTSMLSKLNIQNNISPKEVVSERVTSYIRALNNSRGSNVASLYYLVNGRVEAVEFVAKKQSKFYDRPLRELTMKDNCLIGCIIRDDSVIIPNGDTEIHIGDSVIVVTTRKELNDLVDVFV